MTAYELASILNKVEFATEKEAKIKIIINGLAFNYDIKNVEEKYDAVMHSKYIILHVDRNTVT